MSCIVKCSEDFPLSWFTVLVEASRVIAYPLCEHVADVPIDMNEMMLPKKGQSVIRFDFCTTKSCSLAEDSAEESVAASLWMATAGSLTGAVGCAPLRGKGQIKLATGEVMAPDNVNTMAHRANE